jgi:hypothetical protein
VTHTIPQVCITRFRNNVRLAEWGEKDDRCLYLFVSRLKHDIETGDHKEITDTEHVILKEYLANYIYLRLTNKFIIDVSEPIIYIIDFFESSTPRIHERWDRMYQFFFDILGKFVKNAANLQEKRMSAVLRIDFSDSSYHLDNKRVFLGPKVDCFLKELDLTRDSKEIGPWMKGVKDFYVELTTKMIKYFKPSLTSKSLQDLDILNPTAIFTYKVDDLKSKYEYVANKFNNIIKITEIPRLLSQVTQMYIDKQVRSCAEEFSSEKFFYVLRGYDGGRFSLIGKLGCALLTVENSGSPAERDFSLQNSFMADPRRSNTQQLRLQARLFNKCFNNNLRYECVTCEKNEEEKRKMEKDKFAAVFDRKEKDTSKDGTDSDTDLQDKESDDEEEDKKVKDPTHCHCKLFEVPESLFASMKDAQPWRRFQEDSKKKREVKKNYIVERERARAGDDKRMKDDLKVEMRRLKKKVKEEEIKQMSKVR